MVEHVGLYKEPEKNYFQKAMICVIIMVFTAGVFYTCMHFIVPHFNNKLVSNAVPPSKGSTPYLTENQNSGETKPIPTPTPIKAPEQVLEPPQDYTIIHEEDMSEEEKIELKTLLEHTVARYVIAPVNVISGPNTNALVYARLNEGDRVLVKETGSTYDTIIWNHQIAYIRSNMLSDSNLISREVDLPIRKLDPSIPMVALTFDDGPNPVSTPRILDTLQQYGVVATFFDLGNLVERFPDIVKREEEIGCTVGSHSYAHQNMITLSPEEVRLDLEKANTAFEKALGHSSILYRPPYGNINVTQKEEIDCPFITWNVDSLDWKLKNKNKNLAQIRKTTNLDGHIILMHSIYNSTADTVEVLVPELLEKGYQLVTVQELAYYKKGINLRTRNVYNGF